MPHFVQYKLGYFLFKYNTNMWLKIAAKTDTKCIGNFLYILIYQTNYCINLPKKAAQSILSRFVLPVLANLCKNLSYILYKKFPICFALHFSANLSKHLYYIVYIENFLYVLRCIFWRI